MFTTARLREVVRDCVASKRVIKWGYVRNFGGPSPSDCDSVAAHTAAVSILATILAHEHYGALRENTGIQLDLANVSLMALFHDLGECRSGDTGAAGHGISGTCNLFNQERDGLEACMQGLQLSTTVMKLFDEYRKYSTPESLFVHIADNLEGLEKGLSLGGESAEMAIRILGENVALYRGKKNAIPTLCPVCDYAVAEILRPGAEALGSVYPKYKKQIQRIF